MSQCGAPEQGSVGRGRSPARYLQPAYRVTRLWVCIPTVRRGLSLEVTALVCVCVCVCVCVGGMSLCACESVFLSEHVCVSESFCASDPAIHRETEMLGGGTSDTN